MFYNSQRTIYAQDLSLRQMFNIPYTFKNGTTLNNLLNIIPNTGYPKNIYPTLGYYVLGNGGDTKITGVDFPYSQHQAIDAGLFNMIPFIAKPKDQDLSDAERSKYRLRKEYPVDGVDYVFYFAKRFTEKDIIFTEDYYQISHSESGASILDTITFDGRTDILKPSPVNKVNTVTGTNTNYVCKLIKANFELSFTEIQNLRDAITAYRKTGQTNNDDMVIKEVGICHGVDVIHPDNKAITEVAGCQIAYHLGMSFDISLYFQENQNNAIRKVIELSGMEPYYVK